MHYDFLYKKFSKNLKKEKEGPESIYLIIDDYIDVEKLFVQIMIDIYPNSIFYINCRNQLKNEIVSADNKTKTYHFVENNQRIKVFFLHFHAR